MDKQTLAFLTVALVSLGGLVATNFQSNTVAEQPVKVVYKYDQVPCGGQQLGAYFANWAQYRQAPYTYTADSVAAVANKITHLYYGFVYFCPPSTQPQPYWVTDLGLCQGKKTYDLITVEPKDPEFINTLVGYKSENTNLKVVASIGGWNFPSSFWSDVSSSEENINAFVSQAESFVTGLGFDGLDFDWEYPCSGKRENAVKITCWKFYTVEDNGGDCPSATFEHGVCTGECGDAARFTNLLSAVRKAYPDWHLSIAASANRFAVAKGYDVKGLDAVIDTWNLMTYDYFVSDIDSANITAANQPLYNIDNKDLFQWSVNDSVSAYLAAGATPKKMILGVALYGHSWYVPNMEGDSWKAYGLEATHQGSCCGPFTSTYGAKPGKGASQCGTMMYSEIQAAGFETFEDDQSVTTIGYLSAEGADSYTPAGTWVSFSSPAVIKKQIAYSKGKGLGGAFVFDVSMDSINNGQFTYDITNAIYEQLNA